MLLLITLQSSTYVGAFGAYDRAGSVFKYQPEPTGLTSFINETELTRLVQPVNISEFRDSYLGEFLQPSGKCSVAVDLFCPHVQKPMGLSAF